MSPLDDVDGVDLEASEAIHDVVDINFLDIICDTTYFLILQHQPFYVISVYWQNTGYCVLEFLMVVKSFKKKQFAVDRVLIYVRARFASEHTFYVVFKISSIWDLNYNGTKLLRYNYQEWIGNRRNW